MAISLHARIIKIGSSSDTVSGAPPCRSRNPHTQIHDYTSSYWSWYLTFVSRRPCSLHEREAPTQGTWNQNDREGIRRSIHMTGRYLLIITTEEFYA